MKGMKQIDADVLNVGYAEDGPTDAPAVILLHGWPHDIHSYVEVAPLLAEAGYRAIVPYLRGHDTPPAGTTPLLWNALGKQTTRSRDSVCLGASSGSVSRRKERA
jgi:pimeloyl-ACP methyl ester carboxylesterase